MRFISLQQDVIENVLFRKGHSCRNAHREAANSYYQIPALILEKQDFTIVVSPLISLMKDQMEQLTELGVPVVLLNSSLASHVYRRNVERLRRRDELNYSMLPLRLS